jgi:hypothetical protein
LKQSPPWGERRAGKMQNESRMSSFCHVRLSILDRDTDRDQFVGITTHRGNQQRCWEKTAGQTGRKGPESKAARLPPLNEAVVIPGRSWHRSAALIDLATMVGGRGSRPGKCSDSRYLRERFRCLLKGDPERGDCAATTRYCVTRKIETGPPRAVSHISRWVCETSAKIRCRSRMGGELECTGKCTGGPRG